MSKKGGGGLSGSAERSDFVTQFLNTVSGYNHLLPLERPIVTIYDRRQRRVGLVCQGRFHELFHSSTAQRKPPKGTKVVSDSDVRQLLGYGWKKYDTRNVGGKCVFFRGNDETEFPLARQSSRHLSTPSATALQLKFEISDLAFRLSGLRDVVHAYMSWTSPGRLVREMSQGALQGQVFFKSQPGCSPTTCASSSITSSTGSSGPVTSSTPTSPQTTRPALPAPPPSAPPIPTTSPLARPAAHESISLSSAQLPAGLFYPQFPAQALQSLLLQHPLALQNGFTLPDVPVSGFSPLTLNMLSPFSPAFNRMKEENGERTHGFDLLSTSSSLCPDSAMGSYHHTCQPQPAAETTLSQRRHLDQSSESSKRFKSDVVRRDEASLPMPPMPVQSVPDPAVEGFLQTPCTTNPWNTASLDSYISEDMANIPRLPYFP